MITSGDSTLLAVPFVNLSTYGRQAFSVTAGPTISTSQPQYLRLHAVAFIYLFKRHGKGHVIDSPATSEAKTPLVRFLVDCCTTNLQQIETSEV